jgi:hypothetical protein
LVDDQGEVIHPDVVHHQNPERATDSNKSESKDSGKRFGSIPFFCECGVTSFSSWARHSLRAAFGKIKESLDMELLLCFTPRLPNRNTGKPRNDIRDNLGSILGM